MHLTAYSKFRSAFAAMMVALFSLPAFVTPSAGPPGPDLAALDPGGSGVVVEIIDGDTLVLADRRQVRLVGVQAPKLPLGRENFKTWPLAEEAKTALSEIALDRHVRLAYGGRKTDRHGRALAHLFDADGLWIQGELLRRGLARVYSFPDNRVLVAEMLMREREARIARRGIWIDPFYRVRDADRLYGDDGTFQLIEGRVVDVATVRGQTYVNFGSDWRTDFTIQISGRNRRLFDAIGASPDMFKGRLVRVRGWLSWRNGPMIEATHPEQIEVLE